MRNVRKRSHRGGKFTESIGVALMVIDLWRRLPPKRRRKLLGLARKHGPKVARKAYRARRAGKRGSSGG